MAGIDRVEQAVNELCARGTGLATFDADGVLWRCDSGNNFMLWQIEHRRLSPAGDREARHGWDAYTRGQLGELELAVLCATCLRGLPEAEVRNDASAFFEREIRPQINPTAQRWATSLQAAGVEVWIVSGSHRWLISAGARAVGIREDRVLPVETKVCDGIITNEVLLPVTYGEGKAHAIRNRFSRMPDLAAGNTAADRHMLAMADVSIAVDPDEELEAFAQEHDWPIVRLNH